MLATVRVVSKLRMCWPSPYLFFLLCLIQNISSTVSSFSRTQKFPDLYEASVFELNDGLDRGDFTSVDLVKVFHFDADKEDLRPTVVYLGLLRSH